MKSLTYLMVSILFYNMIFAQSEVSLPKPENVLIVYSGLDDTSGYIANYYRIARNIPNENMFEIETLPNAITIGGHDIFLAHENEVIVDEDGTKDADPDPKPYYNHTMQYVKEYITQPIEDYLNNTIINQ